MGPSILFLFIGSRHIVEGVQLFGQGTVVLFSSDEAFWKHGTKFPAQKVTRLQVQAARMWLHALNSWHMEIGSGTRLLPHEQAKGSTAVLGA